MHRHKLCGVSEWANWTMWGTQASKQLCQCCKRCGSSILVMHSLTCIDMQLIVWIGRQSFWVLNFNQFMYIITQSYMCINMQSCECTKCNRLWASSCNRDDMCSCKWKTKWEETLKLPITWQSSFLHGNPIRTSDINCAEMAKKAILQESLCWQYHVFALR